MTHARWPVCHRWFTFIVFALASTFLCGCGGSSGAKVLYAVGLGSPAVTLFTVSSSGTLTNIGSISTGPAPDAIAIDPLGRFTYILDSSSGGPAPGGVSQYVLNSKTGNLTVATFSTTTGTAPASTPIETGVNPKAIVIDSSGSFVFVANQGSNTGVSPSISVFCIDQIGGTLTEVKQNPPSPPPAGTLGCVAVPPPIPSPLPTPGAPSALATTGKMLFVAMANGGSGSVATYTFDSNGILASPPVSTIPVGVNPSAMQMDPSGKFLFVADAGANAVEVAGIGNSGQLTLLGSSPAGTTPVSIRVHPSGRFLYTANHDSNDLSAFSIDGSGTLKALSGSPFALGRPGPSYVTTDNSGSLLFITANVGDHTISVFSVQSDGSLKQLGSAMDSVVLNPVALASIN